MCKSTKMVGLIRDEDIQMSIYWSKYVTVLITYMDNDFSNYPASKKVRDEAVYYISDCYL